jgi:release factor glutamine methyltransferase
LAAEGRRQKKAHQRRPVFDLSGPTWSRSRTPCEARSFKINKGAPIAEQSVHARLIDVLREAAVSLEAGGIESSRLNAERLLAFVLKCSRVDLYLGFDRPLAPGERREYGALVSRRLAHEPLQYILGEAEFYALTFTVTPAVLIPRPETEILVERAFKEAASAGRLLPLRVCDIGTGSGVIGIILARHLPGTEVVCSDVSPEALGVAKFNAENLGVSDRVKLVLADALNPAFPEIVGAPFDMAVSNPPYVTLTEWDGLPEEIRNFEPRQALLGGEDGLDFYRAITSMAGELLVPGGTLLVETGAGQSRAVAGLLAKAGFGDVHITPDLNGIERVVGGVRK